MRPSGLPSMARAEEIGLEALVFVASEPTRLHRFLETTGMMPADLKANAGRPETLSAVLRHLLEDESLLLVFAATAGLAVETVAPAELVLAGQGGRR